MIIKAQASMPSTIAEKYLHDQGNPVLDGKMLQLAPQHEPQILSTTRAKQAVETTMETKSLAALLKDAVKEKFGSKPISTVLWIDWYEMECNRLKVPENRFWEAIRLLVENTRSDWYQSTIISLGSNIWAQLRNSFLDAFAQKEWASAREAF